MTPITRDLDEPMEIDPYRPPAAVATADNGSSVSSTVDIDNSTNKHLPYIWFNGVLAAFSFGLGVCAIILVIFFLMRVNVSENHWRELEKNYEKLSDKLEQLEKDHARQSDRR